VIGLSGLRLVEFVDVAQAKTGRWKAAGLFSAWNR
jgi:hypothetical protein